MKRKTDEVEIVERPAGRGVYGKTKEPIIEAILETIQTGKAVRVPLEGVEPRIMRERYAQRLWRHRIGLRSRRDGDYLICWAERLPTIGE